MKKRQKGRGLRLLIAFLLLLLAAVVVLIIFKQREYAAGEEFYDSLRGALSIRRARI